jgi:hypothetical protein
MEHNRVPGAQRNSAPQLHRDFSQACHFQTIEWLDRIIVSPFHLPRDQALVQAVTFQVKLQSNRMYHMKEMAVIVEHPQAPFLALRCTWTTYTSSALGGWSRSWQSW